MQKQELNVDEVSPDKIMQVGLGFWGSKALLSAVELGLFTELSRRGQDCEQLRQTLGLHPRSARDLFDTLVALGFLCRDDGGVYRNSPETDRFLVRGKPTYIGGILEMANGRLYDAWGRLTEALRTGQQQNEAREVGNDKLFDQLYSDPNRLRSFLEAMTGISLPAAGAIAEKFDWSRYRSFADVGCAQGGLPVHIARAHPHLKGIGVDLPQVRPIFEDYVRRNELHDRLSFVTADLFKDRLPTADVVVMGHILHDWDLERKRQIVAKAYEALPAGGAFIVYDAMIDDDRRTNAFGLLMSLNMLIETPGGFDYTGAQCRQWLTEAGFRDVTQTPLVGPDSMVVGIK